MTSEISKSWRGQLLLDPPEVRFDGVISARPGLLGVIPDDGGIYAFFDLRGVLYVGQTLRLRRRFSKHIRGSESYWLDAALAKPVNEMRFGWLCLPPEMHDDAERRLIRAFRPPCNLLSYRAEGPAHLSEG